MHVLQDQQGKWSFKQDKREVNCYVILLDLKLVVGTNFTEHSLS